MLDSETKTGSHSATEAHAVLPVRSPLTLRVFLLTLALIPLNAWWITEIEYIRYSDNVTTQALFFNSISLLLFLLVLNGLLGRIRSSWRFAPQELVALYVVVVVASNLAGHDQLQILFSTITYVMRHDTPETGWGTKIIPFLPEHLVVHDKEAIGALYTGNSTLYRWDHILPWLRPLGWWTLFALLVVWTMLCLTALFRRQWDAERLTYPIAEIPVEIITRQQALFRSKLLWAGVAIGAAGQIINMIHSLLPSFPSVPIGVQYFNATTYPLSAAGSLPICSFPFAYGLAFLLPTQLGFSCWFFFLFSRVELVFFAMQGYSESGKFPYIQQQGVGACFGLFLTIVWAARQHLATVWQTAFRFRKSSSDTIPEDAGEPLSYRTTVFGLIGGAIGLVWFAVAAGMRVHTAALFLGILFVIVVVVARLRAELGLPTYELYQVGAENVMQRVAGTNAWNRGDLIGMTFFFWLTRTHRQFPMQTHVDAVRIARRTQTSARGMSALIMAASALGIVCAFWAFLHSMYQIGYDSAKFRGPGVGAFGREPWQKLDTWLSSPVKQDSGSIAAYAFGIVMTVFLALMRNQFTWWPFHPVGYLVSGSFGLFRLWLPLFVSWLIKSLILRYGGLRGYRLALPFFLGLVLGEFGAGFLRTILDMAFALHLPPESGIGGL